MTGIFAIGQDVVNAVKPLFVLFQNEGFAPALSLCLLVAAACFASIFIFYYVIRISFVLWLKTRTIRHSADYINFAHNFDSIHAAMVKTRLLRHAWVEFRETLLEPDAEDSNLKAIRNTVRPQDYFNPSEVGLHFRFFRALPNIFVGVGLLLTFFGLVSALYFATQGIAAGSSFNDTQRALRNLLQAASFKFYTSVAGLTASILLSVLVRAGTSFIEWRFSVFSNALEERLYLVTPEALASEQSQELKQQTVYLKMFTTDVAISVGRYVEEALNKTLPVHLATAMEPVARKLEEVTGNLSRMNEDALKTMAEGFGEHLQGAAGEQVKALANVLQDLRGSLDGISSRMTSSGTDLAEQVGKASEGIQAAAVMMAGTITEIAAKVESGASRSDEAMKVQIAAVRDTMSDLSDKIASSVKSTTDRLTAGSEMAAANFSAKIADAANSAAKELTGPVAEMGNGLDRVMQQMRDLGASFGTHKDAVDGVSRSALETERAMMAAAKAIRDAIGPIAIAGETMSDASRRIGDSIDRAVNTIGASEERAKVLSEGIGGTLDRLQHTWADYERRFAGVDQNLENALEKIMDQVQASAEILRKYVLEFDGKLAGTVDRLNGGIEELTEFSRNIEQASAALQRSVDRLANAA